MSFRLSIVLLSLLSIGAVHAQDNNKKPNSTQIEAALKSGAYARPLTIVDGGTALSKQEMNVQAQKAEADVSQQEEMVMSSEKGDGLLSAGESVHAFLAKGSGKDLVSNNKSLTIPTFLLKKEKEKVKETERALHKKNTTNQSRETLSLDLSNAR